MGVVELTVQLERGKTAWKLYRTYAVLEVSTQPIRYSNARVSSPWVSLKTRGETYTMQKLMDWFLPRHLDTIKALAVLNAERVKFDGVYNDWKADWRTRWEAAGGQ